MLPPIVLFNYDSNPTFSISLLLICVCYVCLMYFVRFFSFFIFFIMYPLLSLALDSTAIEASIERKESRGLVRSIDLVRIGTDLVASVSSAPFHSGMSFDRGDTLISFHCDRYDAELSSAIATADGALIEYRIQEDLYSHDATGKSALDLAKTSLDRARSDVALRRAMMSDCEIKAPFSGRVVDLSVRRHEMPIAGEPLITILDSSRLELELVVPSHWLVWLSSGYEFMFKVDETGIEYPAIIDRLGAQVDPVSQTIRAFGKLRGDYSSVLSGMSGAAYFDLESEESH